MGICVFSETGTVNQDEFLAPVNLIYNSYGIRPGILRGLERSVRPADERPFLLTY